MSLNRQEIATSLINKHDFKTYAEIGVFVGKNFFPIKAEKKIAIDPDFKFNWFKKLKRAITNASNWNASYYELDSDRFFAEKAKAVFKSRKMGVCLVDGMHEYHYALRDVENALQYMEKNGVIIMHDCNPATPAAASTFSEWEARGFKDNWNGDVWKSILHMRSTRKDLNVFVLDCDFGLGIITKGEPESMLSFTPEEIERLTYADLVKNREAWLNLKPASYFYEHFGLQQSAK
ncbi:Methyltransferase domain-containing protein [Chitinophaga jiangningensis]|uniref:Methyltransferase domain-containing protein n=1 Tax=Chitinophaga jiangningensis TaxID=1419482 RepID=A0A1M6WRI4_9BACT|nr:class I SAM-dependent methyltransferase [Chitinophaga jiangningensis]SHK96370.1 Methyltransferase domain-containing protein [Chitinophaga jiangningensis]